MSCSFLAYVSWVRSAALVVVLGISGPHAASAETAGFGNIVFRQAVAEAAYGSEAVATFYRSRDYAPIFTGETDGIRRAALIEALRMADAHGLPVQRYDVTVLLDTLRRATSTRARGQAEALAARMFLDYAHDLTAGALIPRKVDSAIVREVPKRDPLELLRQMADAKDPRIFLNDLSPRTAEYARLMAEKMRLDALRHHRAWGPRVPSSKLSPGDQGPAVVALRNRLIAMGYMGRTASDRYDSAMTAAVLQFQRDHGLNEDGDAGTSTIAQINVSIEERLSQVMVAMERERWLNVPRGKRHVLVNLTDFSAKILDDDKVTFETRSVIGADDTPTPEFSDVMEYLEVNPDWTVPRSIIRDEYLPRLQSNPGALSHLRVVDNRGRVIPRGSVNFSRYTARTFPYGLRQPPGPGNALGTVKFMFPNRHSIYLHDTPTKSLFQRERRAFSHGCIRLADPHDFAYALLAPQTDDPKGLFQSTLRSGLQKRLYLDDPVPVHLIYRTAFTRAKGKVNYRADIYGRDARIWRALQAAGVSLDPVQG